MVKNKKVTINPKNNDDNYFQYALTATLNYLNIKSHPERVSNLNPNMPEGVKLTPTHGFLKNVSSVERV